jgi:hypothetical protein
MMRPVNNALLGAFLAIIKRTPAPPRSFAMNWTLAVSRLRLSAEIVARRGAVIPFSKFFS